MPAFVHKITYSCNRHSKKALLSIERLSEDAQRFQKNIDPKINNRKISRIATNQDTIHRLLLTSDILRMKSRNKKCRKMQKLWN